jgi:hypothetical protein
MTRWDVVIASLALTAGVAGCSASPATTTADQQRRESIHRAADYCRKQGLAMRIDGLGGPTRSGQASSDVQFSCVKAN